MKDFDLDRFLEENGVGCLRNANKLKIPVVAFNCDDNGVKCFNKVYREALNRKWNPIVRTPSGGISISKANFNPPMWDVKANNAGIEVTIVEYYMLRIQFRFVKTATGDKVKIFGYQSWKEWKKICARFGINMDDYAIDNGAEEKKKMEKALICAEDEADIGLTFENCHHLDFHSSHMAGLVNTHPDFAKPVEYCYAMRKIDEIYKSILTNTWGYMQSLDQCCARWAHLSADALADNNKRVREIAEKLKKSGRKVLLYNTDGIWYQGEIYHDENEGPNLGQWSNDHVNCRFRMKSKGAYEFIEAGQYYPVVRGMTKYDKVKPRSEWQWGDIFRNEAVVVEYLWVEGYGLCNAETEELII